MTKQIARSFGTIAISVLASVGLALADQVHDKPAFTVVARIGPTASVSSVAFSPDGARILSGGYDQKTKLWDVATGALLRSFTGHTGAVQAAIFSPDGKKILSGSDDHTAKLWDAATGALLLNLSGHSGSVRSVAFSPDGAQIVTGSADETLKLWDAAKGQLLRTFNGHSGIVYAVAFSPDGASLISGSSDRTVKVWSAATGEMLKSIQAGADYVTTVALSPSGTQVLTGAAIRIWDLKNGTPLRDFKDTGPSVFSPNGNRVLSGSLDNKMKLWDAGTGKLIRVFDGHSDVPSPDGNPVTAVAFSPDGHRVLAGCEDYTVALWDAETGGHIRTFGDTDSVTSVAFSPDGRRVVSGSQDNFLRLWDPSSGQLIKIIHAAGQVNSVAFSPEGTRLLSGSFWAGAQLWELGTGKLLRTFGDESPAVAFLPNGKSIVVGSSNGPLTLWAIETGTILRTFDESSSSKTSIAVSPDGNRVLTGTGWPQLWDISTGRLLRNFEREEDEEEFHSVAFSPDGTLVLAGSDGNLRLWDTATGKLIRKFEQGAVQVISVAFSPNGKQVLSGNFDSSLKLWDAASGALLHTFGGHTDSVSSVAFSPDGNAALSGSWDTTVKMWRAPTGELLASMVGTRDGEWIATTPAGFFAASGKGADRTLSVVRGLEVTTIGQVHQSLFNPDLVRESLAGDPDGELKRAAEVINLDKVIGGGLAPVVEITSPGKAANSESDLATVAARISDRGSGIGRIEWRVNGITAAVSNAPSDAGSSFDVSQQVALDPGNNAIEVTAYNKRNLLASLPAETTLTFKGTADTTKPKLHVLAIGINKYVDEGWVPPGETERLSFPPLGLAVADARALAEELKKAGAGIYSDVDVTTALDEEATAAKLDADVTKIAAHTSPRDTFVFFVAGHGYAQDGRFYLIPQDYQGGINPDALATRAIDQLKLQDWIANRIKAKKALILLDTCESGALTNGYEHSRVEGPASEAGIGRLHEATGRPVLTASAANQYAHEGEIGRSHEAHGVFTWAILDALRNGDANRDGLIELSELVAHVQKVVPGLARGLARAVAETQPVFGVQTPRFASPAEDFTIVRRLQ